MLSIEQNFNKPRKNSLLQKQTVKNVRKTTETQCNKLILQSFQEKLFSLDTLSYLYIIINTFNDNYIMMPNRLIAESSITMHCITMPNQVSQSSVTMHCDT